VIVVAKSNMHEFARGITTLGSLFGQTRNPYALDRNPGGSSGGTGAAIAANFAAVGMGSDTCGSIRIPAAHNSLAGIRGTQGLASRTGIIPLSSTQDIGGPIGRTVADLAIVLDAIVGYDPADPQTAASIGHIPKSYTDFLEPAGLRGARIGLLTPLSDGPRRMLRSRRSRAHARDDGQGEVVVEDNPRLNENDARSRTILILTQDPSSTSTPTSGPSDRASFGRFQLVPLGKYHQSLETGRAPAGRESGTRHTEHRRGGCSRRSSRRWPTAGSTRSPTRRSAARPTWPDKRRPVRTAT
jgi:Asp-tRNA(Asn)/Glu-tRNA(Gln) amidotransferase A subunit family amidase